MASTNKTTNGFSLWVEDDVPAMEDFNGDNLLADSLVEDLKADIAADRQNIAGIESRFTGAKANAAASADRADTAANGVGNRPFQIPASAWTDSTAFLSHPFEAVVLLPGVTATDDALVLFDLASLAAAREAGLADGMGKTVAGGVLVYAEKRPAADLAGTCSVIHREVL